MNQICSAIKDYLPDNTVDSITEIIYSNRIYLRIARNRSTIAGNYRHPSPGNPNHRITVNNNLNKYAFLITFLHEVAHLIVWEKYARSKKPHGKEWKDEFKTLILPYIQKSVFPPEIENALLQHLKNIRASSSSDINLLRELRKYDDDDGLYSLEDLPEGAVFCLPNGKQFLKGKKRYSYYSCKCLSNKRNYSVNSLTRVNYLNHKV